jgi:hypothetical protein
LTITRSTPHPTLVREPFGGLLASFQLALEAENKSPKTVENHSRAVLAFARWRTQRGLVDDVSVVRADDASLAPPMPQQTTDTAVISRSLLPAARGIRWYD